MPNHSIPPLKRGRPKADPERNARIVAALAGGAKTRDVARQEGVTESRITQIYNQARQRQAQRLAEEQKDDDE